MWRRFRSLCAPALFASLSIAAAVQIEASDGFAVNRTTTQSVTAHGACAKITNNSAVGASLYVPTETVAEWQSFRDHPPTGVSLSSCATEIAISGTQANVNLCTLANNPTTPGTYVFTIQPGAIVNSNTSAQPALTTGTCWAAGSTITIINNGSIYGRGGNGGNGGSSSPSNGGCVYPTVTGSTGGPAVSLSYAVTINNSNGFIFGGGGGGGGGGMLLNRGGSSGGGGGGGGQGSLDSIPGTGGIGARNDGQGQPGGAGTASSYGAGGQAYNGAGVGGRGGAWGEAGVTGANAQGICGSAYQNGKPGGAAGQSIVTNGHAVTWLGGNNATQLKGAIQ